MDENTTHLDDMLFEQLLVEETELDNRRRVYQPLHHMELISGKTKNSNKHALIETHELVIALKPYIQSILKEVIAEGSPAPSLLDRDHVAVGDAEGQQVFITVELLTEVLKAPILECIQRYHATHAPLDSPCPRAR